MSEFQNMCTGRAYKLSIELGICAGTPGENARCANRPTSFFHVMRHPDPLVAFCDMHRPATLHPDLWAAISEEEFTVLKVLKT